MAWTSPRTWSSETLTYPLLNTHLRDNLLETMPAKVTTAGDTCYATGANAITRLAIGAAGALYVAGSGAPRWSSAGITASSGSAQNVNISATIAAAANNDNLQALNVSSMAWAKSAFTGLAVFGVVVDCSGWSASGAGTIASAYGIYLDAPTVATANWTLYVNSGNVRLGDTSSKVFIGDTAATDVSAGIVMNGGTNRAVISWKGTNIATGVSLPAIETDTSGYIGMLSASYGGTFLFGINDSSDAAANSAVYIQGIKGTTGDTTKSTAGGGAVIIEGGYLNAGVAAALGANTNILAVMSYGTTRFILDADGDSHQDVGTAWTNFDTHDDTALLNLLSAHVTRTDDPLRRNFAEWLERDRAPLEAARIVTFNDDGHHFINWSRANMLIIGAVRQMADKLQAAAERVAVLESRLALLEGPA